MAHKARRDLRELLVIGPIVALQAVGVSPADAADDALDRFPIVIQCKYKDTYHAFFLSRVVGNGLATYVASDRIAGTIALDGHAKAVGGQGGGSCVGKTLEELRASGQARDLVPR